jgi:hypothetical protein
MNSHSHTSTLQKDGTISIKRAGLSFSTDGADVITFYEPTINRVQDKRTFTQALHALSNDMVARIADDVCMDDTGKFEVNRTVVIYSARNGSDYGCLYTEFYETFRSHAKALKHFDRQYGTDFLNIFQYAGDVYERNRKQIRAAFEAVKKKHGEVA